MPRVFCSAPNPVPQSDGGLGLGGWLRGGGSTARSAPSAINPFFPEKRQATPLQVYEGIFALLVPLLQGVVNGFFVFLDDGHDEANVQCGGSFRPRCHEPHDKKELCQVVKWDSADQQVGEELDDCEDGKHTPIREPLRGALRRL